MASKQKPLTPIQLINEQIQIAENALTEAERLADEYGISFKFGDYGRGATYFPKKKVYTKSDLLKMIEDGSFANLPYETKQSAIDVLAGVTQSTEDWNSSNGGWISSSSNC